MFDKCYLVEINSSLESMFDELNDAGFDYSVKTVDGNYYEIAVQLFCVSEVQECEEIMKWYV